MKPRPRAEGEAAFEAEHLRGQERILLSLRPSLWSIVLLPFSGLLALVLVMIGAVAMPDRLAGFAVLGISRGLFAIAALGLLLTLVWQVLAWWARLYVITDRSVWVRSGVLDRAVFEVPREQVQQVTIVRLLLERLVDVGSVLIETAGSGIGSVVLVELDDAAGVRRIVSRRPRSRRSLRLAGTASTETLQQHVPMIGIAGGIGSGKSAVAAAFARHGCAVVDSDQEARAALDRQDIRDTLRSWWGDGVIDPSGAINRKAVANIVFADPAQRERLEALVHPIVRRHRGQFAARAAQEGARGVVVDAPLLFEAGVDEECDAVVFVDVPREIRLERLARTRGWDDAELARREAAQWPLEQKRARSHYVINNAGPPEALDAEVRRVLEALAKKSNA